jgi:hypothetical protein
MTIKFNLYSSEGCHLCVQALQLCEGIIDRESINVIDIVEDDKLVALYGISIPVLEQISENNQVNGVKLFWPFTQQNIKELT